MLKIVATVKLLCQKTPLYSVNKNVNSHLYPPPPPKLHSYLYFFEVTWPFLVTFLHSSIGKIWLFQPRKIKHWHSKTSQYYIFKEIYLYNRTSIYKFHKLKLETAAVRLNLHSLMVRFSFMRDCGSIPHGDSAASTFSSNFSTITSSKSTPRRRSYVQQSSKSSIYPTILVT